MNHKELAAASPTRPWTTCYITSEDYGQLLDRFETWVYGDKPMTARMALDLYQAISTLSLDKYRDHVPFEELNGMH